jgi:hypothetical protein
MLGVGRVTTRLPPGRTQPFVGLDQRRDSGTVDEAEPGQIDDDGGVRGHDQLVGKAGRRRAIELAPECDHAHPSARLRDHRLTIWHPSVFCAALPHPRGTTIGASHGEP